MSDRLASPPSLQVLDPRTLGRPVHRLDVFTQRFKADLDDSFAGSLNRRYRAGFRVESVGISRDLSAADGARWQAWSAGTGRIAFSVARPVLLSVLHYRYGLPSANALSEGGNVHMADTPETATEARLAESLGLQLVGVLARCIDTLHDPAAVAEPVEFTLVPGAVRQPSGLMLTVTIREPSHAVDGTVRLCLDDAWVARLLRQLTPQREHKPAATQGADSPLPSLPVLLVARLLEKELPLGQVLDLRVGDVIPVHVGPADVLVDHTRLFRATVAEHQGKLCLTSFDDAL